MSLDKYSRPKKKVKNKDPFTIQEGRIKDGSIGPIYRFSWAEDVYMPEGGKKETIGRNFSFSGLPILYSIFLFLFLLILVKTAWLQVVKGEYYYSVAEGNRIRIERIEPKRGIIYDRNYYPLVRNEANFVLYFIPADLPADEIELNDIIKEVCLTLGYLTPDEIKKELVKVKPFSPESYQPVFIVDNIEYEKAMSLYLKSSMWPGVILSNKIRREYLASNSFFQEEELEDQGLSLSHILGYTGKINEYELEKFGQEYLPIDYIGKMGVEYFWENELKGECGKKQIEVDALGKEKKIIGQKEAEDGHNLVISLDIRQQQELEKILARHLSKLKLNRAAVIVMDPNNGEILAMDSWPAYNNNYFARGITQKEYDELLNQPDNPLFNRCISGEYPSGSTVKPIIAAAALEEGIITENTRITSVGGIKIGQWFFPDWLPGGHGLTKVRRALAESINTFFYYIGGGYEDFKGLGIDKIVYYAKLFGLASQTGVDLAGEANGFLPSRDWKEENKGEQWYIGDTYHLSIGQGDILVTPLQVAAYTSVFANGGDLYRPHFVKQILSSNDELLKEEEIKPIRSGFIDAYNINVVRQGLRQAVTSGSARRLQSVPVDVAGKTGTAQWSSKFEPHAWFTGFAPYEDPEIVITVLVEQAGEGSEVAVPIAQEYLEWYFGQYANLNE